MNQLLSHDGNTNELSTDTDNLRPIPNPAELYLKSLDSTDSMRTVRSCLNVVARILKAPSYKYFDWEKLDHTMLTLIKNWFVNQLDSDGKAKYSPCTINNHMSAIKGVCRKAWKLRLMDHECYMRIIDEKPVRGRRIKERQKCSMSEVGEINKILLSLKTKNPIARYRDVAIFTLIACTGLRRSELVTLQMNSVIAHKRSIKVSGKGNKERIVPVQRNAFNILLEWIDGYRGDHDGYVFSKIYKNGSMSDKSLSPRSVNIIFSSISNKLHDNGYFKHKTTWNPHAFRHSYATVLREHTSDLKRISDILGHSDLKTTVGYFIDDDQANIDLVDSLNNF